MTISPFRRGDFVWCAFPQRETPFQPGPRHVGYVARVLGAPSPIGLVALVAYTTSQPWSSATRPPGVFPFNRQDAATFGQARPFVLDLRRLALMPVESAWFPWMDRAGSGIQGRASAYWQQRFNQTVEDFITRRPEIIERLGPLWPPGQ